jgi:prefoldin subunit 5
MACQETQFKIQKSVVSINRVAGYGKKKIDDIKVIEKLDQLEKRINELQESLVEPLEQISLLDEKIAQLVTEEVNLKKKCTIKDGKRIVPKVFQQKLIDKSKEINKYQRMIQKINREHKTHLNLLKKHQKTWFRLQGRLLTESFFCPLFFMLIWYFSKALKVYVKKVVYCDLRFLL